MDQADLFSYQQEDFLLSPIYIIIIFIIGYLVKRNKIDSNPLYKYYLAGLMLKVFASMIFLIIYTEYYGYGDTCDYIFGGVAMSKLMFKDFGHYLVSFFNLVNYNISWYFFDDETGFPQLFMWRDPHTHFVISLTSVLNTLGLRLFMPTTILTAAFSYLGVWKLYLFYTNYYPKLEKQLAIAILFMPSLIFWGSGVMKDTYTFAASGWLVFNLMQIFQKKEKIPLNILLGIMNSIIIIMIKPYIFIALFPGVIIWVFFDKIKNIKNRVVRSFSIPFIILLMFAIVSLVFSSAKGGLGDYGDIDKAIKSAQVIQEDLLRAEQYGTNSYNIGTIDGTILGLLKVAPQALIAGMYRPFIWEVKNFVMLLSGLENLFFLSLTLFLLVKLKIVRFFSYLFSEPILIFSILFSIFFFFAVGLASANFGALVRYKIPAIPFFISSLFIMLDKYNQYKKETYLDKNLLKH